MFQIDYQVFFNNAIMGTQKVPIVVLHFQIDEAYDFVNYLFYVLKKSKLEE